VHEEPPDERLKYLSEILALDAAKELSVINFRHDVLNNQLLAPDKVKAWIEDIANKEQSNNPSIGRMELTIQRPPGIKLRPTNRGLIPEPPLVIDKAGMITGASWELLYYSVPGDKWQYSVFVPWGGILEKLKGISEDLHKQYTWQKAQATNFVLTGAIPLLSLCYSTLSFSSPYFALSTITMKVSPHLSPKEVARIYARARNSLIKFYGHERNRPMSKKHLELAVFYHTHQGMKGAEMMSAWNKEHPEYKRYDQVTHFARDAKHAHDRLVRWVNKGGTQ
jgi:hypothetical protein